MQYNNKRQTRTVLVTGGLGFIGSHVVVQLLERNYNVIIVDNLSNSKIEVCEAIRIITGKKSLGMIFVKGDILDMELLENIFHNFPIDCVMHFAALKSVIESEKYPEKYHRVNVEGTKCVINVMEKFCCSCLIYSSSATVYGPAPAPTKEIAECGKNLTCEYARNKFETEQYIKEKYPHWKIAILRYFNPIGAHPSGLLGENPNDIPNNIFPYLLRVAKNANINMLTDQEMDRLYDKFTIFGSDYSTRDGTCIRDYVHVVDLSRAHIEVMENICSKSNCYKNEILIYNVGTGKGTTVKELITEMNIALVSIGKNPIPCVEGQRRHGDIVVSIADPSLIFKEIGFKTIYGISDMCIHGLNFIGI
jgi:UDP-glucose 4-epimerase